MDKAMLISMFISFATSNDVLKFEPQRPLLNQQDVDGAWPPKFCNKIDCPHFKVVKKYEGYEERLYDASEWVSTNLTGISYEKAGGKMFMKLFGYISGNNQDGKKIAMTAPVTTRIIPGQGPACESNFIMSFYVTPTKQQTPAPTDANVYLNRLPQRSIYVKQFGGMYRKFSDWAEKAGELIAALEKDGQKYDKEIYYLAGYDAPFKFFNRHNEIWFLKA